MTIRIIHTTTEVLDEARTQVSKTESECYSLTPDAGKLLRDKLTGKAFAHRVYVYGANRLGDFVEEDAPTEGR